MKVHSWGILEFESSFTFDNLLFRIQVPFDWVWKGQCQWNRFQQNFPNLTFTDRMLDSFLPIWFPIMLRLAGAHIFTGLLYFPRPLRIARRQREFGCSSRFEYNPTPGGKFPLGSHRRKRCILWGNRSCRWRSQSHHCTWCSQSA